jgi:hypothetical protein
MTTDTSFLVGLGLIAAVLLLVAVSFLGGARRRTVLRRRFGPEYDYEVERHGDVRRAESALAKRERRVRGFRLRKLDPAHRVQFATAWGHAQTRFVDDPVAAVGEADKLISAVLRAQGYPDAEFERRVEDLSVDHPRAVQHYRAARALLEAHRAGTRDTEELRLSLVHYRALFNELLAEAVLPTDLPEQIPGSARLSPVRW